MPTIQIFNNEVRSSIDAAMLFPKDEVLARACAARILTKSGAAEAISETGWVLDRADREACVAETMGQAEAHFSKLFADHGEIAEVTEKRASMSNYEKLMALANKLRKAEPKLSEAQAFAKVYEMNPRLARADREERLATIAKRDAGDRLAAAAARIRQGHGAISMDDALAIAKRKNPELVAAYRRDQARKVDPVGADEMPAKDDPVMPGEWAPSGSTSRSAVAPGSGGDRDNRLIALWRAWQVASPETAPKDITQYMAKRSTVADRVYARAGALCQQHRGLTLEDALGHVLQRNPELMTAMQAEQATA
jgi:hypothetical protein